MIIAGFLLGFSNGIVFTAMWLLALLRRQERETKYWYDSSQQYLEDLLDEKKAELDEYRS